MKKCGICEKEIEMSKTYCSRTCSTKAFRKTMQPLSNKAKFKEKLERNLDFNTGRTRQ